MQYAHVCYLYFIPTIQQLPVVSPSVKNKSWVYFLYSLNYVL